MESFVSLDYGIAGICVLLTIQILVRVALYLWNQKKKEAIVSGQQVERLNKSLEENVLVVKELNRRITHLEETLSKMPVDMRRAFVAIKLLSAEKWAEIRKNIMEDDLPS